jgi:uncharacterized protein (DUF362 family)
VKGLFMSALADARHFLEKTVHADGGWAYSPGGLSQVEPTCFALLALRCCNDSNAEMLERARAALRSWQALDGSFRVQSGHDDAVWPTALALYTLLQFPDEPESVTKRAAAWLLAYQTLTLPEQETIGDVFDIDPTLKGWSWADGTFAWAEPTAWAVLALQQAGHADHPRVVEGRKLLLDRTFDTGGINVGNKRVFSRMTEPVPAASALLMLAFAGQPDHPRLAATRDFLTRTLESEIDLENLCWIRLARSAWGDVAHAGTLVERIEAAYGRRKQCKLFADSTLREALTVMALRAGFQPQAVRRLEVPEGPPAISRRLPFGQRLQSAFRGMAVKALGHLRGVPAETRVHIARVSDYNGDLLGVLREQYAHFRDKVPLKRKRVVLKPNLVEFHRGKVINTHPHVIAAAIELCRGEEASEVIVAEGPGHWRNVEYLVTASGLGDVLREHRTPFVDLNHDSPVRTPNLGRLTKLNDLYLAETIASADVVISLPKLKTHHWAGVTLSLKNLFGTLPGICYGWPKNVLHWNGISKSIVDIALTRTPELAIVDGIIAMEGDGPLNGTPVDAGVLVMGTDLVAVDATCCRIMQLDPAKVDHLALGEFKRLGILQEARITQLGESITRVHRPFEVLPQFERLYMGRQELVKA